MIDILRALRKKVAIGVVGGSDFVKISEQLSVDGSNSLSMFFPLMVLVLTSLLLR